MYKCNNLIAVTPPHSGMGLLGLQNLHYLAKHKKSGLKLLSASNHPQYGFSLAITSINLTGVLMEMLESGPLRYLFSGQLVSCLLTMGQFLLALFMFS